jgi:hypothetical protein
MKLSDGQKQSIVALSKILSLETLLKIMNGGRIDLEVLNLNLFNPDSPEEKVELHAIVEKEIVERRKKLQKAININC